ncbi:MAG: hypothetical protein NUV56_03150 [Candidatus Uhrbacteria bacterium]|nr:hypothetical protein [Candidatus Uhrbacteria bacterium]
MKESLWHHRLLEKLLLLFLFFLTIGEFSAWGSQSVKYVLSLMFNVITLSTPADVLIGVLGMAASAMVFAGSALQWKQFPRAWKFMRVGSLLFMIKKVFDVVNVMWLFKLSHPSAVPGDIETLAKGLGTEFFGLAFWMFIFFYFRHVARKEKK